MTIRYLLIGSGILLMIVGTIIIFNKRKGKNSSREGIIITLLGLALVLLPFLTKNEKIDMDKRVIK